MDVVTRTDTVVLTDDYIEVGIATSYGPRITSLALPGGTNVFAELGDLGIDLEDGRKFVMRGGHRLWASPEVPEVTYEPDDDPVSITETKDSVIVEQTATTDVTKTLEISLRDGTVRVEHTLRNDAPHDMTLAPWAITQLPIGGTAIVPLPLGAPDEHRLQPNASITIWPYTLSEGLAFTLENGLLVIDADRATPTKFGVSLDRGWLAYFRNGTVFVKRSIQVDDARYADHGAAAQCYCNSQFLELETLGPLTTLAPNTSVSHAEVWELHNIDPTTPATSIPDLLSLDKGFTP